MRIALAGLFHETHSFTDDVTARSEFRINRGEALLARHGDGSQIAGFLAVAARHGWEVVPTISCEALPSGVVDHSVFEDFWSTLAPMLREAIAQGLDGIFLSLHGAMVTTQEADPEGELLRRIRAIHGIAALPIFGVFDLHATFTPEMAELANGLLCYRENPHIDAHQCAIEAAELLGRCLRSGNIPVMRSRIAPIVWPPTGTGTSDEPMRLLESRARTLEACVPGVLAINVVAGFSFSDVYHAGVSFSAITTGDVAAADAALDELVEMAWQLRSAGLPREDDLDQVLTSILPLENGPVLLVEPADNIGGGSPGDCTDVLRALIRHRAVGAGVVMADPQAVAMLASVPLGAETDLSIGGKGSHLDPGPVNLWGRLISRSDGRFELEDLQSHAAALGRYVDMGPSAVVQHEGVTVLLTSRKTPPFDLGQWRSQGIAPEHFKLIGVKAAVAHRRAYNPIAKASYTVRTRGPCTSDLLALPYQRLRRPIFPLDA